jgi:prepilin-type N-terminal cleavage/methylation domain-containing protein
MIFSKKEFKESKGFTLIELLVVVAIISLLSSVTLAALNDSRAKARDARRLQDLRQINNALQIYLTNNSEAPLNDDGYRGAFHSVPGAHGSWSTFEYILGTRLPVDPLNGKDLSSCANAFNNTKSCSYRYFYRRIDQDAEEICLSDPTDSDCFDKRGYILDATFEKRRIPQSTLLKMFGLSYSGM